VTSSAPLDYDYILAGGGCAGLSLALNLSRSKLPFEKILIVEAEQKNKNDRTWCYWSSDDNTWYAALADRTWNTLEFRSQSVQVKSDIAPFRYRMIRSADFYAYCHSELKKDTRVTWLQAYITNIESLETNARLTSSQGSFTSKRIFNSAFRRPLLSSKHLNYVQHFKGWMIQTESAAFEPECPLFMDFSVDQHDDCRFVYVLPRSKTEALVEYTGFSPHAMSDDEYDKELNSYLQKHLKLGAYTITETEHGQIPMYESSFHNPFGEHVTNIGTAGGASKTSTGFTFYFIQQQVESLVADLVKGTALPDSFRRNKRFLFYDRVLLQVMANKKLSAAEVFSRLFAQNKIPAILEFLNEDSSLKNEIKLFWSLPSLSFLRAAFQKIQSVF
jgi:lycopene beta-cyclase